MKIAYLGRFVGRKKKTGVEIYAENLLIALATLYPQHTFIVIAPTKEDANFFEKLSKYKNVTVLDLAFKFWWLFVFFGLKKALGKIKPDVFFNPGTYIFVGRQPKSVITFHDVAWRHFPEYFPLIRRFALEIQSRLSARFGTQLIAISESTARDMKRFFGVKNQKITVIPHGIDHNTYQIQQNVDLDIMSRLGIKPNEFILYIGTMQRRKNLELLIDALPFLATKHLVLAGAKGWFFQTIEAKINLSPARERIILAGYITEHEKLALLESASCFVFPSLYEGFGLPLLEAMAVGCPVAASNCSSHPEVVDAAGVLFDPLCVQSTVSSINAILKSEKTREEYVLRGLARSKQFSWHATAEMTMSVLEGTCNGVL